MNFDRLKAKLNDFGLAYESNPNPTKAVCNNCDATIQYDPVENPESLILTISDSLTSQVFYCPNCGPLSSGSMDGVTIQ